MRCAFGKLIELDRIVSQFFVSHNDPRLRAGFGALTRLGTGAVWITLYALLLIFRHDHLTRLVLALILAEVIGLVILIPLRYLTKRTRPRAVQRVFFLTPWNKYSFPSHHALRSFIIAMIVGAYFPGWRPILLVLAAAVGFSRIYLSKHYLSDVLVGALLGILLAMASQKLLLEASYLPPYPTSSLP